MTAAQSRRADSAGGRPERAVVDIGSNTVRMVIYGGPRRTPSVWLNEKVTARLGRDLAETGRIPDEALAMALAGLARFAFILADIGISDVDAVATAAVREAENGPEFAEQVRALGFDLRVLSGEEEADVSAFGVIGAFPGAKGVVADLGGGSLELVGIENGACAEGVSLPLGTLRLPALRQHGASKFRKAIRGELKHAGWAAAHGGPLFMVGGTWRAMAAYAMHKSKYPLTDPHAFRLTTDEASKIAKKLMNLQPEQLRAVSGISESRAAGLPDAAAMLRPVLSALKPEGVVFSSWGLREGLLFRQLGDLAREQDPLLAGIAHFTEPRGSSLTDAVRIAAWTAAVTNGVCRGNGEGERLRLAATMLAMAAAKLEPNMRLEHSSDWAMHKRWLGLDHRGRALLVAALRGACGSPDLTSDLLRLTDEESLREAAGWGLAIRLCRRIGAGSRISMLSSRLTREDDTLVLWFEPERAVLASHGIANDLRKLADWIGCDHRLDI